RYRRFVASSVPRLVDKTRQIVRYTVDRQQEWLRTGRLLEQQRLTRSSTGLVAACDVAPRTAQLLVRSIGPIRVGDRVIEFDSLFTGSDFERAHLVVALTETLTAMGVSDPQRLTLAQERDLRERANAVLNEEMPTYLHRPIADDRLHRCLVMAAPQAKPASAVAAAAGKLWEAETAALRTVLRQHSWRYAAAAATLDVTAARLIEQVRRHDLVQALLDDRHAFICRVYRKAVPEKRTYDDISMVGVRAVAAALRITIGEDIGTPEQGKRRTVEDWVREALHYADAPRTQEIQAQQVEDALARHHGSIRFAAHALHIRERAVVELVDRFQLWERVQGHEDLKIERGLILRK
ncbi:MAG: hypothetical protein Q7R80_03810, partial [bacterium]|nr:hypothetical protein [bacterium]